MALHGMVELALRKKWHYVAAGGAVDMKTKSITHQAKISEAALVRMLIYS